VTPADLQAWRAQAGLSQPGLANLLNVHPLTVSGWECGRTKIPPFLQLALQALKPEIARPPAA